MSEALRRSDNAPIELVERLAADLHAKIYSAHRGLFLDVLELSELSGIHWTQVYAIIDAQAEKDVEKPSTE